MIISRQVTAYHHARFKAAAQEFGRVDILSLANQGKFAEILSQQSEEGYTLQRLFPDMDSYRRAAAEGAVASEVTCQLDRLNPDVVAIAGWASAESYSALIWAIKRARGVVILSDSQAHDAKRNKVRDLIKGRIVRLCGAGLVAGRTHRDYLVKLGLPAERIRLGYDAVDNAHFAGGALTARKSEPECRARLNLPENYILASARFIPKKNLTSLLTGYARARQGLVAAPDLLIAGDGEQRLVLEAAARSLGIPGHVHLPGFFRYEDMPAVYGLSQGFVHVSLSEQWGLVVNEAAACGLPMILSRECGAASELLHEDRNGWSVEAENVDGLAVALRAMMSLSKEQRAEMGAISKSIVADWGPERFARELAHVASLAEASRNGRISLVDRVIIRLLSRKVIETVA
ncbi:glycosyltransferase [Sphingorhabdus sp. YGSMI21]|uniref:glycosyltransferase n=1 Tax=Sphingorhabdus sp. YGSMI21 TaxID=2077182 RepID=UPI000C1F88A9|nr:glycosyltransferase [Sphingorhabdus sp. YGSMI21]ATW03124.1 hypothetical protein CHN51_05875 [Sphingorhabdus sp. YGSMI21]